MNRLIRSRISIALVLLIALSGCHGYVMHPGAYSVGESKIYDAISDAKSILDTARPQLASGALPARFKPAFDKLADVYNDAYPAGKAYHDALDKGLPADDKLAKMNASMSALSAAIAAFRSVK